jgi:high-affinity iron transporter
VTSSARPATSSAAISSREAQTLDRLLAALPARYAAAQPTHDTALAAPARLLASLMAREVSQRLSHPRGSEGARLVDLLDGLASSLSATRERFQPWPLSFEVRQQASAAQQAVRATLSPSRSSGGEYGRLGSVLDELAASPPHTPRTALAALRPFALYSAGPGRRLVGTDPELDTTIVKQLLLGTAREPSVAELLMAGGGGSKLAHALQNAKTEVGLAGQVLGLVMVSRATIVLDGAIIVFREGLEAVLILAAITASFTGARRRLRRPVLLGALAGLLATVLTWGVAQLLLGLLGDGGLRLQAITGLVAIAVLLLVTNWFFHRVYWSEWIARFNRRRKTIERLDRVGFISGQALGFGLLGLSSVYREGFETVLFLQALQTSAGTGAAAIGAAAGLIATLLVGWLTFRMQRKLPFRRMLVVTGMLIALVLAVMVGTTVHNMQGVGWLGATPTGFQVPIDLSTWLGIYATWQGIGAQLASIVFVIGSYFAARELKVKGPRRRARRSRRGPLGAGVRPARVTAARRGQ